MDNIIIYLINILIKNENIRILEWFTFARMACTQIQKLIMVTIAMMVKKEQNVLIFVC